MLLLLLLLLIIIIINISTTSTTIIIIISIIIYNYFFTVCLVRPRVEALLQRVETFASSIDSAKQPILGNGRTSVGESDGE